MKLAVLALAFLCLAACNQNKPAAADKHYPLTGKVISIDPKSHTATVDAAAIPNFMEAMKMEYPIPSQSDLDSLKPGENITATINVAADGSYSLSNIHPQTTPETGK